MTIEPEESAAASITDNIASDRKPGPVREHERIQSLDVLRGFALFGILMVNVSYFAMPFMQAAYDTTLLEASWSEVLSWAVVKIFVEMKFVTMFSILFGIGFIVQLSRAQQKGHAHTGLYVRRLAVLFLLGAIHAFLLWYGDILLIYAVAAIALLFVGGRSPRTLLILGAACVIAGSLLMTGFTSLQVLGQQLEATQKTEARIDDRPPIEADRGTDQEIGDARSEEHDAAAPLRGLAAMEAANFDPSHEAWLHAETLAYRDGPWSEAMLFRIASYGFYLVVVVFFGFGWHVIGMFLLGAAMMKLNFFSPDRRAWHIRLATIALPIGISIEALNAWLIWRSGFAFDWSIVGIGFVHSYSAVLTTLGYIGLVCLLVHGGRLKALTGALASAGRMALSVYLGETILVTSMMYWWGMGLFGSVGRLEQIGLATIIFAALVAFSIAWTRFFRFGPLEWLWRTLTYGSLQPMRRESREPRL